MRSDYVYAPNDFSTCLCLWKPEDSEEEDRKDYVELYRINRYCRIHGTSPKIQKPEKDKEEIKLD